MIVKTQGIVLGYIDYRESSIIAKVFTRDYGHQGFVVNSVRSARSKMGMVYFQPFTVLDMVIYMKPSNDLHRISEFKPIMSWYSENIKRQSILLFLAEVINKLLRNEHSENPKLFEYLFNGLTFFKTAESIENFHLQFLLKMTSFLGVTIMSGRELFENMNEISDRHEVEALVDQLLEAPIQNQIKSSGEQRFRALESLMHYFQHHIPGFGQVQSLNVLHQIFR